MGPLRYRTIAMSQFTDSLHDVFATLGPVRIKRMFGGHGIWYDGLMCALVDDGTLYLKTDSTTAPHFDALELPPFRYARTGRTMETSYRQAPEAVFEDSAAAALWSRRAFEAALRMANARPASAKRPAAKRAGAEAASTKKAGTGRGTAKPAAARTVSAGAAKRTPGNKT